MTIGALAERAAFLMIHGREMTVGNAHPPALVAIHMIYDDFRFSGTYQTSGTPDVSVSGHGYGEFVRMSA